MRFASPVVKTGRGLLLSPHFGRARHFAVVEVGEGGYRVVEVFENPGLGREGYGRARAIVEELARRGVGAVVVSEVGPGAFSLLRERGFRVLAPRRAPGRLPSIEEVAEAVGRGEVVELEAPNEEHGEDAEGGGGGNQ